MVFCFSFPTINNKQTVGGILSAEKRQLLGNSASLLLAASEVLNSVMADHNLDESAAPWLMHAGWRCSRSTRKQKAPCW